MSVDSLSHRNPVTKPISMARGSSSPSPQPLSPRGRGEKKAPRPLGERGWGEGACEADSYWATTVRMPLTSSKLSLNPAGGLAKSLPLRVAPESDPVTQSSSTSVNQAPLDLRVPNLPIAVAYIAKPSSIQHHMIY